MDKTKLKTLRLKHRMLQSELADLTSIKVSRLHVIEKDFNEAKVKELLAISKACNENVHNLL